MHWRQLEILCAVADGGSKPRAHLRRLGSSKLQHLDTISMSYGGGIKFRGY